MPKTAVLTADAKAAKRKAFRKHLKRYWVLYAMLVLPVAYYIVFKYVPMVGNVLAFRRYRPGKGPFGTEWTLRYFDRFLRDPMFWRALRNTLVLSIGNILINFPIPILFAILLNEVRAKKFKKFVQTVSYMPRFISTVVVIAILNVGHMLSLGFEKVLLMYTPSNSGVSDIIDTLVYRTGLVSQNYSYATAIGLFSGIVGLILVTSSNAVSRKLTGESIY